MSTTIAELWLPLRERMLQANIWPRRGGIALCYNATAPRSAVDGQSSQWGWGGVLSVHPDDAANAIRCAAEDWLLRAVAVPGVTISVRRIGVSEEACNIDPSGVGMRYEAPTIHEALAMAIDDLLPEQQETRK